MPEDTSITSSMNEAAIEIFDEIIGMIDALNGEVHETKLGPIVVDLGVDVHGGYQAGQYISQVCLGGLGEVSFQLKQYGEYNLPMITIVTDYPAEATLGSQFAGWSIEKEKYKAMASGPARILARKPKHLFDKLPINEEIDETVIVLESEELSTDSVLTYIAEKCGVSLENLYVLVAPTTSIAGSTQIAGRSVETALHKLFDLGMDVRTIVSAYGIAPVSPVHYGNSDLMMGRTNDMLIYGSDVYLQIDYPNEKELVDYISKASSKTSPSYGTLFYDMVKKVQGDFYKIDSAIFAPAKLMVNSVQTGKTYLYGTINHEMIAKSINFVPK
ncbi:MAG: methenyltetrahydromethanopterin cyclohydrolase [Candidatus Thorarchaeota archaeon]